LTGKTSVGQRTAKEVRNERGGGADTRLAMLRTTNVNRASWPLRTAPTRAQPAPRAPVTPDHWVGSTLADAGRYRGRDLRVTAVERQAIGNGDLSGFWRSRLGKDPVARIGLGIWGGRPAIERALLETPDDALEYWRPGELGFVRWVWPLIMRGVPAQPHTREELATYWTAVANAARERTDDALRRSGDPKAANSLWREAQTKAMGVALADAHSRAVDTDTRGVAGLLSLDQIRRYHHAVFASFGLPPSTYGGTPSPLVPDWIELVVVGAVYADDADRRG